MVTAHLVDEVPLVLWTAYVTTSPSDAETVKLFATAEKKIGTKWKECMMSSWKWIVFIGVFYSHFSFALNTLIPLPCSRESNCWKKSFQDLFPSLQERLNCHQENVLVSLWLLFLLWDQNLISKGIYEVIPDISMKYLWGPFNVNGLCVRPNKCCVPCFDQAIQWIVHWFSNWSRTCVINYGNFSEVPKCPKSNVAILNQ